jgi:hypothetical protein
VPVAPRAEWLPSILQLTPTSLLDRRGKGTLRFVLFLVLLLSLLGYFQGHLLQDHIDLLADKLLPRLVLGDLACVLVLIHALRLARLGSLKKRMRHVVSTRRLIVARIMQQQIQRLSGALLVLPHSNLRALQWRVRVA